MIRVTIAIPIYNVEKYVERSILSALNQTFQKPYEILIVNDYTPDGSMDIVRKLQKEHKRGDIIRIFEHKENRGLAAARNTAINNARGEFIYFMDSDDIISEDCLTKLYRLSKKADCVSGSFIKCREDGSVISKFDYGCFRSNRIVDSLLKHIYCEHGPNDVMMWNKLYRISFLRENDISCPDRGNIDDILFTTQVIFHCKRFASLSDVTYYYMLNSNSLTGGMGDLKYEYALRLIDIYNQVYDFIINHDADDMQWAMEKLYLQHIFWVLNKIRDSKEMNELQKEELLNDRLWQLITFSRNSRYNENIENYINSNLSKTNIEQLLQYKIYTPTIQISYSNKMDLLKLRLWFIRLKIYRLLDKFNC